jgi:hypothetical protein
LLDPVSDVVVSALPVATPVADGFVRAAFARAVVAAPGLAPTPNVAVVIAAPPDVGVARCQSGSPL